MTHLTHLAHGIAAEKFYNKTISGNTTAKHLWRYAVNTSGGVSEITLPENAAVGFKFLVRDYAGTFGTANCIIKANGEKIHNVVDDYVIDQNNVEREFEKYDASRGWIVRRVG